MFRKIVDVLKEVFWLKPTRKKSKSSHRPVAKKSSSKVSLRGAKRRSNLIKPLKVKVPLKGKELSAKPISKAIKPPKKAAGLVKKVIPAIDPALVQVGEITHYFERIKVCVVKITHGTVLIGDRLTIIGPKTKFVQKIWSMQIESVDVKVAKKGQLIGLKVDKLVAVGDKVYK